MMNHQFDNEIIKNPKKAEEKKEANKGLFCPRQDMQNLKNRGLQEADAGQPRDT